MRVPQKLLLLTCGILLLSASEAQSQAAGAPTQELPRVELPSDLDRVLRDYETSWEAGDGPGLAALFTEDGFILRPGHPPTRGRSAIADAYSATAVGALALWAYDYSVDGGLGYIIGGWGSAPAGPAHGKFVLVLEKGPNGAWLIKSDMDNANRRP